MQDKDRYKNETEKSESVVTNNNNPVGVAEPIFSNRQASFKTYNNKLMPISNNERPPSLDHSSVIRSARNDSNASRGAIGEVMSEVARSTTQKKDCYLLKSCFKAPGAKGTYYTSGAGVRSLHEAKFEKKNLY